MNEETATYHYDALRRLLSASTGGWSDTYAYDGCGDLTGMNGTAAHHH